MSLEHNKPELYWSIWASEKEWWKKLDTSDFIKFLDYWTNQKWSWDSDWNFTPDYPPVFEAFWIQSKIDRMQIEKITKNNFDWLSMSELSASFEACLYLIDKKNIDSEKFNYSFVSNKSLEYAHIWYFFRAIVWKLWLANFWWNLNPNPNDVKACFDKVNEIKKSYYDWISSNYNVLMDDKNKIFLDTIDDELEFSTGTNFEWSYDGKYVLWSLQYLKSKGKLNSIKSLRISGIRIEDWLYGNICDLIGQCSNLQNLSWGWCTMSDEHFLGILNLKKLKKIQLLNATWITRLPDQVFSHPVLRQLRMTDAKWLHIESNSFNGSQLEQLYLSNCNISKLPNNLNELKNIKHLMLAHNTISSFDGIELPTNLKRLDLFENKMNEDETKKLLDRARGLEQISVDSDLENIFWSKYENTIYGSWTKWEYYFNNN